MNSIKKYSIVAILFIAATFYFQSCVKDHFEMDKLAQAEYEGNFAAPLVYSSLGIKDILAQDSSGLVSVGSDNFCTIIYKGNLFTFVASDLIQIPTQTPVSYTSPSTVPAALALIPAGNTFTVSLTQPVSFNPGTAGVKIDSVLFKQGDINISLSSDFRNSGNILLTIPAAKKNGVAFSKNIPINYTGTVPMNITIPATSLAGYRFDMTKGGTTFNAFDVNIDLTFTSNTNVPLPTDKITVSESISNLKFDRIYGDLGKQNLSPNKDTVELSVFSNALNVPSGSFSIDSAKIYMYISNSYGVPIGGAKISMLDAIKQPPGSSVSVLTTTPYPLYIPYPNWSEIGQTKTNIYTFDKLNSNIVPAINSLANYLVYEIESSTNTNSAGTYIPTHSNFVLDTSKLKIDLEVHLPLYGTAKNFILVDTTEFEFNDEVNDIEWALIRTYNKNGFPLDVNFQAYFVDSLYNKIDSVFKTQPMLKSGILNSAGKVITPSQNSQDVVFTKAQLEKLKKAKHMLIRAVANTSNNGNTPVKIYSDYKLDVKLGIQVQLKKKI